MLWLPYATRDVTPLMLMLPVYMLLPRYVSCRHAGRCHAAFFFFHYALL